MTGLRPAPISLNKTAALAMLARQAGIRGPVSEAANHVAEAVGRLPVLSNRHVTPRRSGEAPSATARLVMSAEQRHVAPPIFTNGRPDFFPGQSGFEESPAFEVLELEGGFVAQIGGGPAVLACDGTTLVSDYSSPYAGLLRGYDLDMRAVLGLATRVAGTALVLCSDIDPPNFCHWMLDQLPRLAAIGRRRDVFVVTSAKAPAYQRESLRMCGLADRQIVHLREFEALQADRLLASRDLAAMPHPAFKAAPWALDFLRSRIGLPAVAAQPVAEGSRKLFISRDDSLGRRIINEAEFLAAIEPLGYRRVTLAGRPLADQAALFARATHVLGMHGAGLTHCAFAPIGSRLMEVFARSYGMPSYYVVAAGLGNQYATYIASEVIPGERPQIDDVRIDVGDFMRCCGSLL